MKRKERMEENMICCEGSLTNTLHNCCMQCCQQQSFQEITDVTHFAIFSCHKTLSNAKVSSSITGFWSALHTKVSFLWLRKSHHHQQHCKNLCSHDELEMLLANAVQCVQTLQRNTQKYDHAQCMCILLCTNILLPNKLLHALFGKTGQRIEMCQEYIITCHTFAHCAVCNKQCYLPQLKQLHVLFSTVQQQNQSYAVFVGQLSDGQSSSENDPFHILISYMQIR